MCLMTHTRAHIWGVGFKFENKIAERRKPRCPLPFDCFASLSGQRNLPSGSRSSAEEKRLMGGALSMALVCKGV